MTLKDFLELAFEMRKRQKRYCTTRERLDLQDAKRFEAEFDAELSRLRKLPGCGESEAEGTRQGSLYEGEM